IGDHAPVGAVFRNRRFTGEIIKANAPGRDPVITRIIWLRGLQAENAHAFSRCIYIHGTPEEKYIGRPASYGCIRMKSGDVAELYAQLPLGTIVEIVPDKLPKVPKAPRGTVFTAGALPKPAEPAVVAEGPERAPEPPAKPAGKAVRAMNSAIDKAAKRGIIHKNAAKRRKARLNKLVIGAAPAAA